MFFGKCPENYVNFSFGHTVICEVLIQNLNLVSILLIEVKELTHFYCSLLIYIYGSEVWVELFNLFVLRIDKPHG